MTRVLTKGGTLHTGTCKKKDKENSKSKTPCELEESHLKAEERLSKDPSRIDPANTLTSGFENCGMINFCCLHLPVCGTNTYGIKSTGKSKTL